MEGRLVLAWLLAMVGIALMLVGPFLVAGLVGGDRRADGPDAVPLPVWGAIAGGGLLAIAGLAIGCHRSIVLRRNLGEDRYRGASIWALLAIVVIGSVLASLPLADGAVRALAPALEDGGGISPERTAAEAMVADELALFVALASMSVMLLAATVLFVVLPRALPGVRLFDFKLRGAAWRLALGVLIGAPAWVLAIAVSAAVSQVLGAPGPDEMAVERFLGALNPIGAVVVAVVLAPVSEEVFFRGVVFNAWEREYGYWRALIGSSVVFALIHLSVFAFLPILALALILAFVYAQTRSLLTVIAIHASFNAISTAFLVFGIV